MVASRNQTLDDGDYARLSRQGDRVAFSELVRRYQDRIYRFVMRMVRSREDALDLTQETFVRAWQALPQWRPEAAINTWLFQIARNLAIDHLRRRKSVHFVSDDAAGIDLPQERPGPEAQAQTAQQYRLLEAALQQIAPEHREIMLLREVEGLSYDEIAQVLAINPGTVKSRIARARHALLARMQRHE